MVAESKESGATRRTSILESAMRVFLRYGFKKTSMDDLARAANLSRQGLYLHFRTKDDLFKAAVSAQMESMRAARKAALAREDRSVEERIVGAFEVIHGSVVGELGSAYMNELMETATALIGPTTGDIERELVNEVVRLLRSSGIAETWKSEGLSAKDLGEQLFATSFGVKHQVTTPEAYRAKMTIALRILCSRRET